jgi:hypothetical protein
VLVLLTPTPTAASATSRGGKSAREAEERGVEGKGTGKKAGPSPHPTVNIYQDGTPSSAERGRLDGGAPPGNPVTTPFPCFLSTERVCSEAEQGLPCEIVRISTGQGKG